MIHIAVPATSANCLLGFDSTGLALDWLAHFYFEKAENWRIKGCPEEYCNENNLVVTAYRKACESLGLETDPFSLRIDSDLPFARGLGSSSTCVIAGVAAAFLLHHQPVDYGKILEIASRIEGHPDNVAPALLGGLISCFEQDGKIFYSKTVLDQWHMLAVIPDYPIETPAARKVLPASISRLEAAAQTGRALVFFEALRNQDLQSALAAGKDALHEPYRQELIKDYGWLKKLSLEHECLMWISGSGSTMLVLSLKEENLEELKEKIRQRDPSIQTRLLHAHNERVHLSYE